MKYIQKKHYIIVLILIMVAVIWGVIIYWYKTKPIVLEFGMFTGSNWDVASADSFIIIDDAIKRFEERYAGKVKIHYYSGVSKEDYSEWFAQKLLQGKEPDVFMVLGTDFNQFSEMGVLKELDTLINNDTNFYKEKFFTTAYCAGQYEGVQYALPYETVPTLMFVNKTLLTKSGIEMPDYDWTWEDMYSICQKVTKDTNGDGIYDRYGVYNFSWQDAVYTNGCEMFNADGTESYFTDDRVVESIKYIYQLNQLNHGKKLTQEDFKAGKIAFMPLTFAEYRTYKTYPYRIRRYADFQWDCITMPAGENGKNVSQVDTLLMGIGVNTKHEDLAWEFLKLLTYDEEVQAQIFQHSQGASVLKNVTQSERMESIVQENMEEGEKVISGELLGQVIETGYIDPKFRQYKQAVSFADGEIAKIIEEEKNIDSSLKILQQTMGNYLEQ